MPRSQPDESFRGLTHLTPEGAARMVDVSAKPETSREAVARAVLRMTPATLDIIRAGNAPRGCAGRRAHRRYPRRQATSDLILSVIRCASQGWTSPLRRRTPGE
jgi:hypothetical protein